MNKEFIKKAKQILEKEKSKIEKQLSMFARKDSKIKDNWNTKFPDIGVETTDSDLEDQAKKREVYERLLPVEFVLETKLRDIDSSLKKIARGKYGICEKCHHEISEERLLAKPEAKFCMHCYKPS